MDWITLIATGLLVSRLFLHRHDFERKDLALRHRALVLLLFQPTPLHNLKLFQPHENLPCMFLSSLAHQIMLSFQALRLLHPVKLCSTGPHYMNVSFNLTLEPELACVKIFTLFGRPVPFRRKRPTLMGAGSRNLGQSISTGLGRSWRFGNAKRLRL